MEATEANGARVDAEFRQGAYEQALRLLQDKQKALSPRPSGLRNKGNAESVMALASLYHSGLWHSYSKTQRVAA